ncbi:hypothetical protein KUCAC02_000607, partial [Chaenocephalus aceratus]
MGLQMLGARVEMACRRSGNGLGLLLILVLDLLGSTVSNMEPIFWNSLNERCDCAWAPAVEPGTKPLMRAFCQQWVDSPIELDTGGECVYVYESNRSCEERFELMLQNGSARGKAANPATGWSPSSSLFHAFFGHRRLVGGHA